MNSDPWHYGTWEGARDATREDNQKLSFRDKVSLLESMEALAILFNRHRHREGLPLDAKMSALIEPTVAEAKPPYPLPPHPLQ